MTMACSSCLAASLLLLLLVVGAAADDVSVSPPEQELRVGPGGGLAEAGVKVLFAPAEIKKDGAVVTGRLDDDGNGKGKKEDGKECLSKEQCRKKKVLCAKKCTLAAHAKCTARCTKACLPTC